MPLRSALARQVLPAIGAYLGLIAATVLADYLLHRLGLLWIGRERTEDSLRRGLELLGENFCSSLRFVCSDLWRPYLKVLAEQAGGAAQVADQSRESCSQDRHGSHRGQTVVSRMPMAVTTTLTTNSAMKAYTTVSLTALPTALAPPPVIVNPR